VATLNQAKANQAATSHADLSYPFCEPSSRPSTTMDYYHLLLTGVCTPNKAQVRRFKGKAPTLVRGSKFVYPKCSNRSSPPSECSYPAAT
jgi:hypothetical protein